MGKLARLGIISIILLCVTAGVVSAAVSITGPSTVTRGGVSDGQPNVDGYFNFSINANDSASWPMNFGVVIIPQTMSGEIGDRPPFLINTTVPATNFILGEDEFIWPQDFENPYKFSQASPSGNDEASSGAWDVPWDGTHYYGLINTNTTNATVGTLYPNANVSTSLKPGTYTYHLQSVFQQSVPGTDSTDISVTVRYGDVTGGAYNFTAWSKGSLIPVSTIQGGHTVMLQGTNTDSDTTYLWVGGEGYPKCGQYLDALTVEELPSDDKGAYLNGTWYYQWTAPCTGGTYTIYASSVNPTEVVSNLTNKYALEGCSASCSEGGICGLIDCPIYAPAPAKVSITVTEPEFSFTVPAIVERCCCEVFPCGSSDSMTSINLTGQTGTPQQPVRVWLFGNNWLGTAPYLVKDFTSGIDAQGTFNLDLRTLLSTNQEPIKFCDLDAGEYKVIIQIPACGSEAIGVGTSFIPTGLNGYDAYKALIKKLNDTDQALCSSCPAVTDQYIVLKFSIRDICNSGSVDFIGTPVEGYTPLSVNFSDASTFIGTSYSWDFGDNITSTEQNPTHAYAAPGIYSVTFKITNGTESKEQKKFDYIIVNEVVPTYGEPAANFTYVPKTDDPMTIQFIDQSVGATDLTYLWTFGDGTNSTEKVPAHTYSSASTYTVTLTITDVYSHTSTASQQVQVPASPGGLPVIDFNADVTSGEYPLTVQFLDNTTTTWADSWQWNFGDGTVSSLRSPSHTYSTPGQYTVTLRAANVNGEGNEMTKENYIIVQNQAPVISASADPTSGNFPLGVTFTASATVNNKTVEQSTPLIKSWLWDFGDSSISTEQNPVHVYETPGSYPVTVLCQLVDGVSSQVDVATITVGPLPYANFYWEYLDKDETCCYLVKFTDTSVDAVSWLWDFGDGLTATEQNPTHRFKEVGSYNVTLTVADNEGDTSIMTKTVQITAGYTTPTPTPTPTAVPGQVTADFTSKATGTRSIQFTDSSEGEIEGSTTWNWTFGDSTTSELQNPTHLYSKDGEYTVVLKVSNGKFSDSVTKTIGVR